MTDSLFDQAIAHADGYRDIEPKQLSEYAGTTRLVDVREPGEYLGELGHIQGTALVPLATVSAASSGWDRQEDIVMICRSGARSGRAAKALVELGFTRVMNMKGGMLAWNQAGLPVKRVP